MDKIPPEYFVSTRQSYSDLYFGFVDLWRWDR